MPSLALSHPVRVTSWPGKRCRTGYVESPVTLSWASGNTIILELEPLHEKNNNLGL